MARIGLIRGFIRRRRVRVGRIRGFIRHGREGEAEDEEGAEGEA